MLNAACDADYAKYTTKNADNSWTINIDQAACTRL